MSFGKFKDPRNAAEPSPSEPAQDSSKMHDFVRAHADNATKAFLSKGSKVNGQVTFEGPAEIEGELEGEVVSHTQLIIGRSARVKAKITGQEIVVLGSVQGDIKAAKRLVLKQPAQVAGNIAAPSLSIEEGVVFQGNCRMDGKPEQKTS